MNSNKEEHKDIAEHLFRVEYGKIVSVIGKYLGISNLQYAEDITQDTFYKAVSSWQHHGIPDNPEAWLYTVAKNKCINLLKRESLKQSSKNHLPQQKDEQAIKFDLNFSKASISDDQLRMMFACCHSSISTNAQIALMLKVLCGFSISEIASAFFSSYETINKRLTRAKNKLKKNSFSIDKFSILEKDSTIVLHAIYLLFNEGYSPATKNKVLRKELCFQAIRMCEIIKENHSMQNKNQCYALLSLMYLNVSRFEARNMESDDLIEMKNQDRSLWNQDLIKLGLDNLNKTLDAKTVSSYHILAAISANHCIATEFEKTDWEEILNLYNNLIQIDDSPIIKLNRSVAIANAKGNAMAIRELEKLRMDTDIQEHYLFHSTIAEFYSIENKHNQAIKHLRSAISKAGNPRDIELLRKKLAKVVPI
jgi:RNA polymerase sigma-70 factor (ECF subfamily)